MPFRGLDFAGGRGGEREGRWEILEGSGLESTWEKKTSAYKSYCRTMLGEDSQQGICGAEPVLVEGIEDMQVQERRGWSVPLVAWKEWESGPGPSSPPSISHQPFPALAAHPGFMGESFCETVPILLLMSVPIWGNCQPCPASLLAQTPADPGARLSAKTTAWGAAGSGQVSDAG